MNLAAIDIGTNSIHMIIVKVTSRQNFEIILQEKEMVKLGEGVFKNKIIGQKAFDEGIETIKRYVQLADKYGVEDIITAATSATREAKNGREFLDCLILEVGLIPQLISGKEEARLIFLAVKHAIEINGDNALVLDIGGGSTEAVVGNKDSIFYKSSMKLGVLRLLDHIDTSGPLTKVQQEELKHHIKDKSYKILSKANGIGFNRIIGTSGTIRALGEACLLAQDKTIINSINAEVVDLKSLEILVQRLVKITPDERSKIPGIGANRTDAIHLGGMLLIECLRFANLDELTLCDASLREGLIMDYLDKRGHKLLEISGVESIKERSCLFLASRYETDIESKKHISNLALTLFDQLRDLHQMDTQAREMLYHASLVFDIGLNVNFKDYHKHSRYLILNGRLRGFNSEETLLLSHLARYHRKSSPGKKHKKYKKLDKAQRKLLKGLSGILRIAVGLDKTKNQWVEKIECLIDVPRITIKLTGEENLDMEIWEAQRYSDTLSAFLHKEIVIVSN